MANKTSKNRIYIFAVMLAIILASIISLALRTKSNPNVAVKKRTYVALGDSVTAGVGLETASDSSACDRTDESYPNIIAKKYNYELHNIACSGATTAEGISGSQAVNSAILPSQLNQLFTLKRPSLVSVSIGANDIGWTEIITRCFTTECGSTKYSSAIDEKLTILNTSLHTMFQTIQSHYTGNVPAVVLTGYYSVFNLNTPACSDTLNLSKEKLTWWALQEEKLNKAIQSVSKDFTFAHYVNIDFSGHELCTSSPWVQGLNDKAPFHPNDGGQKTIADMFTKILATF